MAQQSTHEEIANWWRLWVFRVAHYHTRRALVLRVGAVALLLGLGAASQVHRATLLVQAAVAAFSVAPQPEIFFTGAPLPDGKPCQDFSSRVGYASFTAVVPACEQTGPLTVTTFAGSTTTAQALTVVRGAPIITSFSPTSGPVGTSITITGTNLQGVTSVNYTGGCVVAANLNPDGAIWAVVPICAQTVPISVDAPYGSATSTQVFTAT